MFLSCVAVLVVCAQLTYGAYPIFGTKRYGRSVATWAPLPLTYYQPRATRPFTSPYYDADLPEYYYPQDPYAYFPDKYPIYQSHQSLVPYYYSDQIRPYGYYGYDEIVEPVDDLQDDMIDEEREEREDALPYGQETWYDNGHQHDNNAEANAVFLKNLILAQMYNDRYGGVQEEDDGQDGWVYGDPINTSMPKEDEDVRQLKSLIGNQQEKKTRKEDIFASQRHDEPKVKHRIEWPQYKRSGGSSGDHEMKFTDRKLRNPATTMAPVAAAVTPSTTLTSRQGQKEVVLPRPASPVRTPNFHKFVSTRSRQPSVYDTIKKLLNMQEQLEKVNIDYLTYFKVTHTLSLSLTHMSTDARANSHMYMQVCKLIK